MKVARWQRLDGMLESGFLHEDWAVPLPDMRPIEALLYAGLPTALGIGRDLIENRDRSRWRRLDSVRLRPPFTPASIRDFVTFEQHVDGMVRGSGAEIPEAWYEAPTFYFTNPHTLIGPDDKVIPPRTERLDFEAEVAAVIGARREVDGRNMTLERSKMSIFGYTIFNDWTARDLQAREMQVTLGPAKGKDFAGTLGPWIVTADEFAERYDDDGFLDLEVEVLVNGAHFGRDSLANMGWSFPEMIAYASRASRVAPGDVLASGTVGTGCLAELWGRCGQIDPPPLIAGDTVTVRVEGIGEVTNTIGKPVEHAAEIPPARGRR